MNIITIGSATQDIFIQYDDALMVDMYSRHEKKAFIVLEEGTKVDVDTITVTTGGGATNAAVAFKRLGFNVTAFFKMGYDLQALSIKEALHKEGIILEYCIQDAQQHTGISYIIPTLKGDRTALVFRGANASITADEFPWQMLRPPALLYITSMSGKSSQLLVPITSRAKKAGLMVANNPGNAQVTAGADALGAALPFLDILMLNSDEAKQFMLSLLKTDACGTHALSQEPRALPSLLTHFFTYQNSCWSLIDFFKEMRKRGPHVVVVTDGAQGVYVCAENTIYYHPSLPVKVVSTLGAGDAFGSAFVAGLQLFNNVEKALFAGLLNSASAISCRGAQEGLLTLEHLTQKLAAFDNASLLQKFDFL